jgi:hypothetical protein
MEDKVRELNLANLKRLRIEDIGLLLVSEFASEELKGLIAERYLRLEVAETPEGVREECFCFVNGKKPMVEWCLKHCSYMQFRVAGGKS